MPTIDGMYTFEASYNGVACSKSFTITHSLGIIENGKSHYKVYPNPSNNDVFITAEGIDNGNYSFSLTNSIGQIIKSEKINIENNKLEKTIAIADIPDGIYFLVLENAQSRVVKKIIKQK